MGMDKKAKGKKPALFTILETDNSVFCSSNSPVTSEELEILADLRRIKAQARTVKTSLSGIRSDWKQWLHNPAGTEIPDEAKPHLRLLAELQAEWRNREKDYQEARHRRMVALGHEDP